MVEPEPTRSPEESLALAVLERALLDVSGNMSGNVYDKEKARADAYDWIFDERTKPMTFIWVCTMTDLCHLTVRKHIREIIETGRRESKMLRWRTRRRV